MIGRDFLNKVRDVAAEEKEISPESSRKRREGWTQGKMGPWRTLVSQEEAEAAKPGEVKKAE